MRILNFNQEQTSWQQLDNRSSLKRLKRSDNNPKLPENFEIGQAIGDGDCFFDSVAKGLVQIKTNEEFTVKLLRELCHKYALENEWVKTTVVKDARLKSHIPDTVKDNDIWNAYLLGIRYTADDIEKTKNSNEQKDLYRMLTRADYGETLVAPIWGRSEIEGRMICEKYNVKLHVVEKHNVEGKEVWTNQIVDKSGSKSISAENIDYSKSNVIHIVNEGHLHFEPVLSTQEVQHGKQQSSDLSDYDDNQMTLEEELINTVRNSDSQEEKLDKIQKLLGKGTNIDFQDASHHSDTPLHIAVRNKELKVIELLVGNKANIHIKNDRGRTPLDIAERLNRQDIVQILEIPSDSQLQAQQKQPQHKRAGSEENTGRASKKPAILPKPVHLSTANRKNIESRKNVLRNPQIPSKPSHLDRKRPLNKENEQEGYISGRSRISLEGKPKEYPASGLKNTLHGNIYQLKLLMLFLKRGLKNYEDRKYSFRLATEWDAAEKFDDLVFQYENERKDGTVYRFLQAKHKQDESKKITVNDLLTETDGEFSLQKYFISYRRIKQNPEFNGKNDELKDFVICTNIDLSDDLQNSFKKVIDKDNILDIDVQNNSKEPKRLKLEIDNFFDKEKIVSILKNTSDLNRLAKKLAECVLNSKPLNLNDELFKLYHDALAKEVVDVKNAEQSEEINKGKAVKKIYAKFLNGFLGGSLDLSPQTKDFRNSFLEAYLKMPREQVDIDAFWKDVGTKKLQISKNFGKVFELDVNPKLTDPKEFAQAISNTISIAQQSIVNIKREGGKGQGIIKGNIDKLAGHVLIKKDDKEKDIYYFSSAFFNDNNQLPGDLESFRNELKAELESKSIGFNKDEYKFHVANFKTCEEEQLYSKPTLPNDYVADKEIRDFFEKLVFAVNQPNEVELGRIIKSEIGKEFNYIDSKNVYSRFQKKMLNWMKEKEGYFLSHEEGKAFFEKIKEEILGTIWFDVKDPVELFTGRKEELKKLHEAVQRNPKSTVISQMTSISGLGGIGKSELAKKYAYDYGQDYDGNVIWINAENYETLVESFLRLARDNRLGVPTKDKDGKEKTVESIVKEIYVFFAKRKSLFIFDNAERNEDVNKFLPIRSLTPDANKSYILITSREKEWEKGIEVIELNELKLEDAIEFVKKGL